MLLNSIIYRFAIPRSRNDDMNSGNARACVLLIVFGGLVLAYPIGAMASEHRMESAAVVLPKGLAPVAPSVAQETGAKFDLVKAGTHLDPPWSSEDTIGNSATDDESPTLAANINGTSMALYQIKNGSTYDIGYAVSSKGSAWSGGYIKNASFDPRNISVAAFNDGRFMAISEDWSNRTRLVRYVTEDEGNTWKVYIMNMQQGAGGYKYVTISNPSLAAGDNKTLGDYVFGTFTVVTNASAIKTVGILYSYGAGGKTGVSYSHFNPQVADTKNTRASIAKSKATCFMRGYITCEFTNTTNTDAVLLHNNLPSQGMWALRQYSPASASYESDTGILSEGSNVLWVMSSGSQANADIVSLKSTDDAATFGAAKTVVGTATTEQFPSASMSGNVVWITYAEGSPNGNWKAVNSTDGGSTWGTPVKVISTSSTLVSYSRTGQTVFTGGPAGTIWTDSRKLGTEGRNVYYSYAPDTYAPRVIWSYPRNGSINVSTSVKSNIVFTEAMNGTATEPALSFSPSANYSVTWPKAGNLTVIMTDPLNAMTKYTVTVGTGAKDISGNTLASPYSFEFTTGIGDNTPPMIFFVKPKNNDNVSGTTEINATATDNVALVKVQFDVDATEIINFTKGPFKVGWDSTKVADGQHELAGTAWDSSGNTNTTKIKINVKNQDSILPTVNILFPANNSVISKNVTIKVDAKDNIGIKWVLIKIDATELANITTPPYEKPWDTRTVSDGTHDITAIASDLVGNNASVVFKVIVANNDITPPTISFLKPSSGAKVFGDVTVQLDPKDNLGIAKVEVRVDSGLVQTLTASPYQFTWNSKNVSDGSHKLNATAYDGALNKAYAEITIQVKNNNLPPAITHTPVTTATEGSDVTITATITDDNQLELVSINVTYGSGDVTKIVMTATGKANEYSGTIGGSNIKAPKTSYYIYAQDNVGMKANSQIYDINVKRAEGISMTYVYVIIVVIVVVVVLILVFIIAKGRKSQGGAKTPSSPFGAGPPEGRAIGGSMPDFGIGDGRPEEGMEGGQPQQGYMPQQGYQQQPMPQQQYGPMGPSQQYQQQPMQPQYQQPPPTVQQRPPMQPPAAKGGEDEWGFPSTAAQPPGPRKDIAECPSCGGTNQAGSKWCTNCGGKIP